MQEEFNAFFHGPILNILELKGLYSDSLKTFHAEILERLEDESMSSWLKTPTFIMYNQLHEKSTYQKVLISCYYALTTLSTVGFGDYYPVSNVERVIAVLIMLGGVAFFSYIMGNFIEIISNYEKKMGIVDKSGDLHNWMILLTRFTNNPGLKKTISQQIEQNFTYHWAHDRLQSLQTDSVNFIENLPVKLQN